MQTEIVLFADFVTMRLQSYMIGSPDSKIRSGVDMKPNFRMKCRYF
jgi:hypothetical protein